MTGTKKAIVERQISLLRLEHLGKQVKDAILESGVDHHAEVEGARQEAWQEVKEKYLKGTSSRDVSR